MKTQKLQLFVMIVAMSFAMQAWPQSYLPVSPQLKGVDKRPGISDLSLVTERIGLHSIVATMEYSNKVSEPKTERFPVCVPAPTVADMAGGLSFHQSLMSSSAAAKLGIPVADVSMTGNQMVMVQDYSRTKTCLANDGKTGLVYGQAIRMIITIENFESKSNLTLPAIAATATIGGERNSVKIEIYGFENPKLVLKVAEISGKELNVETYAKFAGIHSELMKLTVDPNTKESVERLGIVSDDRFDDLATDVVTAFALQQIKDGKSCEEAKRNYRKAVNSVGKVISRVYSSVQGSCTAAAPNARQTTEASDYLDGLQVKYPIW
jgi:hypothetical protein